MSRLYPHTGGAFRVGVTGPPGVGKSTLVSGLVEACRSRGLCVGVISVDPSSPFSMGAVLGDRIRLASHFLDRGVFIRSMGARGHLGGLAEATLQAVWILEASGMDVIFMETVGVGQSEVEIVSLADAIVLVLMPGSGDSVQALKAGVMEIPDFIVVNKMDHPAAQATVSKIKSMVTIGNGEGNRHPAVVETQAVSGEGVSELWDHLAEHSLRQAGGLEAGRGDDIEGRLLALAERKLGEMLAIEAREKTGFLDVLTRARVREVDSLTAADALVAEFLRGRRMDDDPSCGLT